MAITPIFTARGHSDGEDRAEVGEQGAGIDLHASHEEEAEEQTAEGRDVGLDL